MRRILSFIIPILCASLTAALPAAARGTDSGSALLGEMEQRFGTLDSLIFAPAPHSGAPAGTLPAALPGSEALAERRSAIDAAIGARVDAEIATFKSDPGIQLTGQTYYRLDGAMGFDEDDPQSRYNGKLQIEARWYVLQSSLYKRQGNIRAIRLQGDIDRALRERDRLDQCVYAQKEHFRAVSDSLLSGVLQHRIANLDLLSRANLYLLERGDVSSDELLRVLDDKAQAERQLATLRPGMPAAAHLTGIDAREVVVDTAALMRHIHDTSVDMRLLGLRLQLLEQQEQNTSYWSDCRVAPFVRYSYYARDYAANSQNVDAGISFTVPINTKASHQRRALQAQRRVLEAESDDMLGEVTDRVRYYATEIDRLNRACRGEVDRMGQLRDYLTMRARGYDNRNGEYNRLSRLKEYNNYLVCIERLIAYQYQRDCYVADLQRLLDTGSILDFCTERPIT